MSHPTKKILCALPLAMLDEMDRIAAFEHRNRSDLIRESLRRYSTDFKKEHAGVIPPAPPSKLQLLRVAHEEMVAAATLEEVPELAEARV